MQDVLASYFVSGSQGVATEFFAEMLFGSTPAIVSFVLEETLSGFGVLAIGSSIGSTVILIITQQLFGKLTSNGASVP